MVVREDLHEERCYRMDSMAKLQSCPSMADHSIRHHMLFERSPRGVIEKLQLCCSEAYQLPSKELVGWLRRLQSLL